MLEFHNAEVYMYPQKPNMGKGSLLHSYREEILMIRRAPLVIVGIDLAGSPRRVTELCVLRNLTAETRVAFSDDDILDFVREAQPTLVPIDAPLTLPKGRSTVHDRSGEHLRDCDRKLLRRGIRFFPITLGPMRMLTEPGLALKTKLISTGYQTVDSYPSAAQDLRQEDDLRWKNQAEIGSLGKALVYRPVLKDLPRLWCLAFVLRQCFGHLVNRLVLRRRASRVQALANSPPGPNNSTPLAFQFD